MIDIASELQGWSDTVLQMLHDEEDCSDEFRELVRKELAGRPHAFVVLTSELLHEGGTKGCGFNAKQLALLGVPLPQVKGWLSRLVGTKMPAWKYRKFIALKGRKEQVKMF